MLKSILDWFRKDSEPTEPKQEQPQPPERGWRYMMLIGEVKRQAEERGDSETVQQALNLTYERQMPIQKPDGSYSSIYNPVWDMNIAGINFRKGISKYVGEFVGYLKPEPENEYDEDAIAIYHSDGNKLGYIPADYTDDLHNQNIQFPFIVWGVIEDDFDYDENRKYYRGKIYIEIPDPNRIHPVENSQKL